MALIKCNECGHEVSDRASVCPNCGCPIDNVGIIQEEIIDPEPKKRKGWIWALIVVLLCLIGGGGYYAYTHLFLLKANNDKEEIVELTPEFAKSLEVYDELAPFSEGYAAVRRGKKWGYINTKGEEVIVCSYDYAEPFSEGYAAVNKDTKWGYINNKGEEVIPFTFDNMPKPFCEGLAAVCKDNKWGWIDKNGETAIPFTVKAEDVGNFSEGLAFVYRERFDSKFSFIDKNGKDVFSGKMYGEFYHSGYRGSIEPKDFPSFHDGVVYVPTEYSENGYVFTKYDKQGKKYESISFEELPIYRKYYNDDMWGVKRGNDIVVLAKYNMIDDAFGNLAHSSNGVFLVGLYEYGEGGEDEITTHYGYADLKGNDTFSDKIKEHCRKSKELLSQYNEEVQEEDNSDWLQGRWVGTDSKSGYSFEMIINGNNLIQKIDGQVCYNGSYQYDGNILIYNNANDVWAVDKDKKVLTLDGVPMRKEDGGSSSYSSKASSQPTTSLNAGSSKQEKELKIMARLHELGKKGQSLVSELSAMRQRGQMDPARYLYIKQALIQYKDEQIRLSQELGDEQMAREYMQQKDGVLQSFRMIENGY